MRGIHFIGILLCLLFLACDSASPRRRAILAVTNRMTTLHPRYRSAGFGQFFEQTYPEEIAAAIDSKAPVKYSLVHSYYLGNVRHESVYFHLDSLFQVLGALNMKEMMGMTLGLIDVDTLARARKDSLASDDMIPHGTGNE